MSEDDARRAALIPVLFALAEEAGHRRGVNLNDHADRVLRVLGALDPDEQRLRELALETAVRTVPVGYPSDTMRSAASYLAFLRTGVVPEVGSGKDEHS